MLNQQFAILPDGAVFRRVPDSVEPAWRRWRYVGSRAKADALIQELALSGVPTEWVEATESDIEKG